MCVNTTSAMNRWFTCWVRLYIHVYFCSFCFIKHAHNIVGTVHMHGYDSMLSIGNSHLSCTLYNQKSSQNYKLQCMYIKYMLVLQALNLQYHEVW